MPNYGFLVAYVALVIAPAVLLILGANVHLHQHYWGDVTIIPSINGALPNVATPCPDARIHVRNSWDMQRDAVPVQLSRCYDRA